MTEEKQRADFDMALYTPSPGRVATGEQARKLRESEMAAFESLAKQTGQ